jgi:nucleotide-binding universal stress UspA family protein
MKAVSHVLVATDLSPASRTAIDRGLAIATDNRARLSVLHALELPTSGSLREWLMDKSQPASRFALLTNLALESLEQICKEARRDTDIQPAILVAAERAETEIERMIAREHVDLVVVSALGAGARRPLLLGSTTSRLLRTSSCPVLVTYAADRRPYRRALIAVDFSPASLRSIELVREIAPDAEIHLLHVYEVPFEGKLRYAGVEESVLDTYKVDAREHALRQLRALVALAGLDESAISLCAIHGHPVQSILERRQSHACDLVVAGKHGTDVTAELLLGSTTRRLLIEAECDTLVVVDRERRTVT